MISRSKPALLLLAAGAVIAAAQTNAWEFGHPDAKLLMGVDLQSLRESAVGESIRQQMKMQPAATGMQGPIQAMALGLLEQIDHVFLSSPANMSAGAKTNPPFLLAVQGRLPMSELQAFLKETPRKYRGADVYRTSKTATTSLAILDGGTLLLGDEKSVLAAIDRRGRALLPASALLGRAKALAATHDFWIIADGPLSKFQPASSSMSNPMASQIASQINGIDMGLSLRDGFQLALSLTAANDAVAAQMSQLLSTQVQMAALMQANRPDTAELLSKLHIGAEGNRMSVNIALTKEEFEQQLRAAQAARTMAASAQGPAPAPAMHPVKPATPGKITIYGLDGGPRVVGTTPTTSH